ncbi:hypothetical protein [Photorhabdus khanii]|nr:hypothetical protein [Photorhabdus khanii]
MSSKSDFKAFSISNNANVVSQEREDGLNKQAICTVILLML